MSSTRKALLRDLVKSNKGIRVLQEGALSAPMSITELNDRIERSMADAAAGKLSSLNKVRKEAAKW